MRAIFADPKVDFIFKKIFGDEDHPERLISLLNPLLELDELHRIVEIEFLPPEQRPVVDELKLSIVDVKCKDALGTTYVVEMQLYNVPGFEKRVVYNVSKAYVQQLKGGEDYPKLNDVIGVTICNFSLFGKQIPMLSRWHMREQHTEEQGLPQLQYVFLELDKYQAGEKPRTLVEKWAYFFLQTSKLEKVPSILKERPFEEALEVARVVHLSPDEWDYYDRVQMARQDAKGAIEFAQAAGREKGRQEGLQEGRQEGLQEGRKEGRQEGRREGKEEGKREGLIEAIGDLCELFSIPFTQENRNLLYSYNEDGLQTIRKYIKQEKAWPKEPYE